MKEKVAICINSLRIGGSERVVSTLLQHLNEEFDFHLVLYSDVVEYKIPHNVKIFSLAQSPNENIFAMLLKGPLLSYRLYRYCKKNSITSVVGFLNRGCYVTALAGRLFNFNGKTIMCQRTHQSALVSYGSSIYRLFSNGLLKWSYEKADLILANSNAIADDLQNYVPDKQIQTIYNPIDLEEIKKLSAATSPYEFESGYFYFIVLGGLRKEKNHKTLLQAFSLIKNKPAKLLIVGGGELGAELNRLAAGLKISEKVIFLGSRPNPFPLLLQADCLILPSLVEGFPNALLEGLACGKPVISADCYSGPREILAPGTLKSENETIEIAEYGILVPVNNTKQLAKAMEIMMEDHSLRQAYAKKAADRISAFQICHLKEDFIRAFSSKGKY
ncbi:MAG: glycosyltransferase [Chitinophagaceae bacterium]|nr:MAG: glycosyltransferase [Chitinophagaceae bacterium]